MDKLPAYTLYPMRLSLSQSGFAPIALVVLLLFGIAAGTLLVQQGTNLLPHAEEPGSVYVCGEKRVDNETTQEWARTFAKNRATFEIGKQKGCTSNNCPGTLEVFYSSEKFDEQSKSYKVFCKLSDTCKPNPDCKGTNTIETGLFECIDTADNVFINPNAKRIGLSQLPGGCTTSAGKKGAKFATYAKNENGRTYCNWGECIPLDSSGAAQGQTTGKATVQDCKEAQKTFCTAEAAKPANTTFITAQCYIVDGTDVAKSKCMYKADSCNKTDSDFCGSKGCKIIIRDSNAGQIKYSVCGDGVTLPPGGAANPVGGRGTSPGGTIATCTNTKLCNYSESADKCFSGVCKAGSENDCGFNRNCIADPAGLCTKPVDCKTAGTSGYSSSSATGTNPAVSTTCGVDDKGLQIPCYKIGVFDETTLQATIADARIASANYALYRKIIDDLQKFVDTSQAAAKTAAAQRQADACINNTAI